MKKTLIVARHEFRVLTRNRFYRITTMGLPLLALLAVLGFMIFQSLSSDEVPESVKAGYVDLAGIVTGHEEQGNVSFTSFQNEEEAKESLLSGDIARYYVIPNDYLLTGQVTEYTTEKGYFPSESGLVETRAFLLANLLGLGEVGEVPDYILLRLTYPADITQVHMDEGGDIKPPPDYGGFGFFFALGTLLLVALFTASGTLLQGLGEEKENRIMEVLLSSLTPGQLMTGKIVGLGTAGLLQVVVWVAAGMGIFALASEKVPVFADVSPPGASALLGILYFILGYALFGALFSCVGALASTTREANQLAPVFYIPAIIPFYISFAIQDDPTGLVSRILTFFPLTSPVTVLIRLAVSGIEAWEIVASIIMLLVCTATALWVAGRVFGIYLLMYGKRPALKEVWRALRSV
ncbi:ABC transporter permease [Chloroflexota bacterium]